MPSISSSDRHHCLNCATITTAIALVFCMRIYIKGICGLTDASSVENRFIMVDAVVVDLLGPEPDVDRNKYDGGMVHTHFCPQVKFQSRHGEKIVPVISRKACAMDALNIVIGSTISIRYNPQNPNEFIEEDELEAELTSLKIMMGVGMALSFILSGIFFLLLKWQILKCQHRYQRQRFLDTNIEQFGNTADASDLPTIKSLEERKEQIVSRLCFQTVLGNTSNTATASIRSMKKIDSNTSNSETMDTKIGDVYKKEKDCNGSCENGETTTREHGTNCPSELEGKPAFSTMTLMSSWMTPAHDAECSICLEKYKAGEVICASKSRECNHVFHKECLMDWMMKNNDKCPLCRVNFMKEV